MQNTKQSPKKDADSQSSISKYKITYLRLFANFSHTLNSNTQRMVDHKAYKNTYINRKKVRLPDTPALMDPTFCGG